MRLIAMVMVMVSLLFPASAGAQLLPGDPQSGWVLTNPGRMTLDESATTSAAPELHFRSLNGHWLMGGDVANNGGGGRDFVTTARLNTATGNVEDILYLRPDQWGTKLGVGVTPPSLAYRLQTAGQGPQGGLAIIRQPGEYGHPFAVTDSNGTARVWVDADYSLYVPRIFVGGTRLDPPTVAATAKLAKRVKLLERRIKKLK